MVLKDLVDWQSLGLQLGLFYPTLDKIETEQHRVIEMCKTKMLVAWFKLQDKVREKGAPSWSVLQRALQAIGENELANQITSKVN